MHRIPNKLALAFAQRFLHPRVGAGPSRKAFGDVEITPFKYDAPSTLCISVDFELSWAFRYGKPIPELEKGIKTRNNFPSLLKIFDRFLIPITWATVGHIFLESCNKDSKTGLAHPDMPRPKSFYDNRYWEWKEGDWYHHDPCTNYKKDPNWYAPDLINQILKSKVEHEIGVHTFSHIDFSSKNCDKDLARAEIRKCIDLMSQRGLVPKSMVFPGNFEGHFNILRDEGLTTFRGVSRIDLSYPTEKCIDLWDIHMSYFLYPHRKAPLRTIKRYLKQAQKKRRVFHLGFHPSDMNQEILKKVIEPFFQYVFQEREANRLWIATMVEIAAYCAARNSITIETKKNKDRLSLNLNNNIDLEKFGDPSITLKIFSKRPTKKVLVDGKTVNLGNKECFFKGKNMTLTIPSSTKSIEILFN